MVFLYQDRLWSKKKAYYLLFHAYLCILPFLSERVVCCFVTYYFGGRDGFADENCIKIDDQRETSIVSLHFIQFQPTVEYTTILMHHVSCIYIAFKRKSKPFDFLLVQWILKKTDKINVTLFSMPIILLCKLRRKAFQEKWWIAYQPIGYFAGE